MLPFRSGRAGFVSALAAFSFLILLSCVVLAAEKKPSKSQGKTPTPTPITAPTKKSRPKPEEGIKDVPIPEGHDARGLVLPEYDIQGRLRGKLLMHQPKLLILPLVAAPPLQLLLLGRAQHL